MREWFQFDGSERWMTIQTWKLKNTNITVEYDGNHYFLIAGRGPSALVNRLDSFNTSYQLSVLREIGQPESHVK